MTDKPKPLASRAPPPHVSPVFLGGVRYAQVAGDAEKDAQVAGFLAAFDAAGQELWRLKVYEKPRRAELEGDVQDVWFRSLRVDGSRLRIENERGEQFEVDPATRQVIGVPRPNSVPGPDLDPISGKPRIRRPS